MRFPTMWYVRPAKPQISLRICAVWSEPLLVACIFYECLATDWTSLGVSKLKRRLHRLVWVYTCQIPHCLKSHITVHILLKRPLKRQRKIGSGDRFMQVKSSAQYFWPCIKVPHGFMTFGVSILRGFTVYFVISINRFPTCIANRNISCGHLAINGKSPSDSAIPIGAIFSTIYERER